MKLETSCYDSATGRMTLRRFGPAWILYTVCLLLLTVTTVGSKADGQDVITALQMNMSFMTVVNFGFALVITQLLFGDLYQQKLCFAIQSQPISRSGWFGTQIILGILGSLIPNVLNTLLLQFFVQEYKIITLWWFAASECQFLAAFGFAVLCAILAGNRIGMLIGFAMVNLFDVMVGWMRMKLYARLIYGIHIPNLKFNFSPFVALFSSSNFVTEFNERMTNIPGEHEWFISGVSVGADFWLLPVYALVGCAAIWAAMRLFRKRRMEHTGELLAFPIMEKPIALLCTLFGGCAGHMASYVFSGEVSYLMLLVGMVLGYYASLMLLRRRVNVFTVRSVFPVAGICVLMLLTLTLTGLNVFGIAYRIPETGSISEARMSINYSNSTVFASSDSEQIQKIIGIQESILREHQAVEAKRGLLTRIYGSEDEHISYDGMEHASAMVRIQYQLKNGSTVYRIYVVNDASEAIPVMREIFSQPETVMRKSDDDTMLDENGTMDTFAKGVQFIIVNCAHELDEYMGSRSILITSAEDQKGLLNAFLADCAEGHGAQHPVFHEGKPYDYDNLEMIILDEDGTHSGYYFAIWDDCVNTFAYLAEHDLHNPVEP